MEPLSDLIVVAMRFGVCGDKVSDSITIIRKKSMSSIYIKKLIESVVKSESNKLKEAIGPSKSYTWKEDFMQKLQKDVAASVTELKTQEELNLFIDKKIVEYKAEVENVFNMIGNTLKQIPIDILKKLPS